MAKLRIVTNQGRLVSYDGRDLVFDTDKPEVNGMSERERAEAILWMLNRNSADRSILPLRLEES